MRGVFFFGSVELAGVLSLNRPIDLTWPVAQGSLFRETSSHALFIHVIQHVGSKWQRRASAVRPERPVVRRTWRRSDYKMSEEQRELARDW